MQPKSLLIGVIALLCSLPAMAATDPGKELVAHIRSFAPDAGGFQAYGGLFRINRFQVSAHLLSNGFEGSVQYVLRPDAGAIRPRLSVGAGYYQTLSLVVGAGVTFRLFKLFGSHFGLALDHIVYLWPANGFQMAPWTIAGLSFAFG